MRIAYLDCASGIAGDMMLAALIDAGIPEQKIVAAIQSLGLPDLNLQVTETKRRGFRGLHVQVTHPPEHAHRHLHHIHAMIDGSKLNDRQKDLAKQIFHKVAVAEAKVHGSTLEKVHFHEVGAIDSIADIVGTAVGWDLLDVDQVYCSPIPTGTGFIEIAHGRCSVPAPATAEILTGIPLQASNVPHELTTPTGAAIVATLVDQFGPLPSINIEKIGYGCGTRQLEEQANLLRLVVGTSSESSQAEQVTLLETNLDDQPGEVIGHTIDQLFSKGAIDVYCTPIQMKKSRPGVILSVLCLPADVESLENLLFRETGTLGIRRVPISRRCLTRNPITVETPLGPIRGKTAQLPSGEIIFSPEFESCREIAHAQQLPLRDVYQAAHTAYSSERSA